MPIRAWLAAARRLGVPLQGLKQNLRALCRRLIAGQNLGLVQRPCGLEIATVVMAKRKDNALAEIRRHRKSFLPDREKQTSRFSVVSFLERNANQFFTKPELVLWQFKKREWKLGMGGELLAKLCHPSRDRRPALWNNME